MGKYGRDEDVLSRVERFVSSKNYYELGNYVKPSCRHQMPEDCNFVAFEGQKVVRSGWSKTLFGPCLVAHIKQSIT